MQDESGVRKAVKVVYKANVKTQKNKTKVRLGFRTFHFEVIFNVLTDHREAERS